MFTYSMNTLNKNVYVWIHVQSWSELLAPLVNMIKEGGEN